MLPKSSRHFVQPTADELNLSPDLVDDAVTFFYSKLRKRLTDMKDPRIQIENLGTFKVKPRELRKLIAKYTNNLAVLKPESFNQMRFQKKLQLRLLQVKQLQIKVNREKTKKTKFIIKKNAAKYKKNMEQS